MTLPQLGGTKLAGSRVGATRLGATRLAGSWLTRTGLLLFAALVAVEAGGLTLHAVNRMDLEELAQGQALGLQIGNIYRAVVLTPPEGRDSALRELDPAAGLNASLDPAPAVSDLAQTPAALQRMIRVSLQSTPLLPRLHWRELSLHGTPADGRLLATMRLPEDTWLNVRARVARHPPFWSQGFLLAWLAMAALTAPLVAWAMHRLSAPMRRLAAAAERLGVDVNTAPLPEDGPADAQAAARAFNTMAARIRRFVHDRTFLLTAIGHDLRTPITRLKLRAEWMDDEEQRRKMLIDLDELEAMVSATLAFGQADARDEAPAAVDLAELMQTILEEAGDARPHLAPGCAYAGPAHLPVRVRPVAMKRALTNLVLNALNYGGSAHVTATPAQSGLQGGAVTVLVEDDGPGIPPGDLERVFEPFQRLEASRNRETGGTGLGLPIARNILRAHGGDVVLVNRAKGGLRATITLPA